MNPIGSGPARIIKIAVQACSKILLRLLKALEQGSKMFQKFLENRLFTLGAQLD